MSGAAVPSLAVEGLVGRVSGRRMRARLARGAVWLGFATLVWWTGRAVVIQDTDWRRISWETVGKSLRGFLAIDIGLVPSLLGPAVETALMATLATLLGVLLAVPVAWLGAGNISPLGRGSYLVGRALMTVSRSVHEIVWGLLFVAAAGLGALAGILAMGVRSVGFIAKTVAEAIEDVDRGPVEAMRAVGANRLQVLMFAIVPQVLPAFLGNVVFEWDVNIRRSTIMGLVGAGGLGLALHRQMAASSFGGIAAVILVILCLIVLGEIVSHYVRKAVI